MYLNKTQIIGNLTRDPELKALPSGSKVCNISVATNRTWKDSNGAKQEAVDYHNIVIFGKMGETIAQWFVKGQQIYIEGRLSTRSWEDKEGKKQYRTEIIAENFQFGQKPNGGGGESRPRKSTADEDYDNYDGGKEPNMAKSSMPDYPNDDINPDDIPF